MTKNHFYEKEGPFPLNEIVKTIGNKLVNLDALLLLKILIKENDV